MNAMFLKWGYITLILSLGCADCANAQIATPDAITEIHSFRLFYRSLSAVGSRPPTQMENAALLVVLRDIKAGGIETNIPALENYFHEYSDSPWLASLDANLGRYYREQGYYSKALKHWEHAWQLTGKAVDGPAKEIGDFTFAYWTQLLASLGRVKTLEDLFQETQNRVFDHSSLQQIVNSSREGYRTMLSQPGICFKCGTYALDNVGISLRGTNFDRQRIDQVPSPVTGFNMTKLLELSDANDLGLVAVKWSTEKNLVVPSVVHWKENHYAALTDYKNGRYRVIDPTFGRIRWLKAESILEEASGEFLVPVSTATKGWEKMRKEETDKIYGSGYDHGADDDDDGSCNGSGGGDDDDCDCCGDAGPAPSCNPASSQGGNSSGPADPSPFVGDWGSNGGGVGDMSGDSTTAIGMPTWKVSEPYISTWLYDEPLGYQPGLGQRISFRLAYKQRESRDVNEGVFSLGPKWNCSWLSYIIDDPANDVATMTVAGGGQRTYTPDNSTHEFFSHTVVQRLTSSGTNTGFIVNYAGGAKDYYQFVPSETIDTLHVAFLTAKVDAFSHSNAYFYHETNYGVLLDYVVDMDGRTNFVTYTNTSYPLQITGVKDPFGRFTVINYDASGMLTNLTDVVGMSSSFKYDFQGWVTNLVTPYGLTQFFNVTNNTSASPTPESEFDPGQHVTPYAVVRAVTVIDPMQGTNIYLLRQDSSYVYTNMTDYSANNTGNAVAYIADANYTAVIPPTVNTAFDNSLLYYRDSFHWGPRQSLALSTTNVFIFSPADLIKARMRHWLHYGTGGDLRISQTKSMEQAPSPDGILRGQTKWYSYAGQSTYWAGGESKPLNIGLVLPDGTSRYKLYFRDAWGRPTNKVDTYSDKYGHTPQMRTNTFVYDINGINLIGVFGPKGELLSGYKYDTKNQLLMYTNSAGDISTNGFDSQGRLTMHRSAMGLGTENIYYTNGAYTNWVQTRIDVEISRTNSFSYTNDLVYLHTNTLNVVTTNFYDNLQRITQTSDPRGSFLISYNKLDVYTILDRIGSLTTYLHDANRRMIDKTDPLGRWTHLEYCTCGALQSRRDALGNITYYNYNNAGWLTNIAYPDLTSVTNVYSLLGQLVFSVNSFGIGTSNLYNNQGLLYASQMAYGTKFSIAFDIEDRATNVIDANNVSVNITYDNAGRMIKRVWPDTGQETFGHSARGLIFYTNQLNAVWTNIYDAAGRKMAETNANGEGTTFTYDSASDLLTIVDGKQQQTSWQYDKYSRATNKLDDANNSVLAYAYDANNRLQSRWSAAKGTTYYSYDAVGNLTNITYPVNPSVSFAYNALNRMTNMIDGIGTSQYTYDAVDQLAGEQGLWNEDKVSYFYYFRGLLASLQQQRLNANTWYQSYNYDKSGRLTNTVSLAGTFGYTYDLTEQMNISRLSLPNGAYVTNDYDSVARILDTQLKNSGNVILDASSYTYNEGNQRTQQTLTAGNYDDYTYDNIGQVTAMSGKEASGASRPQNQLIYKYDQAHNLTNRSNAGLIQDFAVNDLNELTNVDAANNIITVMGVTSTAATSVTVNGIGATLFNDLSFTLTNVVVSNGINSFTAVAHDSQGRASTSTINAALTMSANFVYDSNGNLITDGKRYFAYDDENQLICVWVTNSWQSKYVYDGRMRRRIRQEFTWNGGSWSQTNEVHYIYDKGVVIQERDVNNLSTIFYTRGKDLSGSLQGKGGIGGLLAMTQPSAINWPIAGLQTIGTSSPSSPQNYYYHSDGIGNITSLIDASQTVAAKYQYSPFGAVIAQSGLIASINVYQMSSKEYEANAGLNYFLYRFYDSDLQRWSNRDPIGELGGINLYAYVQNDPVDRLDSRGLWGTDANANPGGVNGPPALTMVGGGGDDGCGGRGTTQVSNNDSPELAALLAYSSLASMLATPLLIGLGGPDEVAATTTGAVVLSDGDVVVGVVVDGQVVPASVMSPIASHAAAAAAGGALTSSGTLVEGAQAFTAVSTGGQISVLGSGTFGGILNVSDSTAAAVRAYFSAAQ